MTPLPPNTTRTDAQPGRRPRRTGRFVALLLALVGAAILIAEALLRPPRAERWQLAVVLAAPALLAAAVVPVLGRWVQRRRTVAAAGLTVGIGSLAFGVLTTSAASSAMFVSDHDHRLFLIVLALSCGLALLAGWHLSAQLRADLARLGVVVDAVGRGDLTMYTGVTRRDEVGRIASALDAMIGNLSRADAERARIAEARRLLLTGVGHDLRTPLAAIQATMESLQDDLAADPRAALGVIGSELGNVQALLEHLTEYGRLETGTAVVERHPVSVSELAHEAVEALSPVARRRRTQLSFSADGPAMVRADELDIARAIRNVLDNAIGYSPAGGTVEVTVSTERTSTDEGVVVSIADDGPGFAPEFRERAFEPFTRADPSRRGGGHAGLGLAIARTLVGQHHGRIWIADGPGGRVVIWLPLLTSGQGAER